MYCRPASPNTSPLIARSAIPITANGGGGRQRLFGGHPAARTALTDGREVQARPSAGLGSAGSIPHDARYEQWYGWQHLTRPRGLDPQGDKKSVVLAGWRDSDFAAVEGDQVS